MLSDLLRQLLAARPFIPFTLHLADGHHLEIQAPGTARWLDDGVLAVVIPVKPFAGSLNSTDFAHYIDPRAITRIVTTAIPAALLPPEPEPLPPAKDKVLFICTHNSARSQMAEALLRHFAGDRFEAASAGLQSGTVHPLAVQVMQEIGLDIIPSDCARKCNRVTRSRRSCGEYHFARGMGGLVMGHSDCRDELRRRRSGGSRDTDGASQIHITRAALPFQGRGAIACETAQSPTFKTLL